MWNPESIDMECGIHSLESRIQVSLGLPYMGRYDYRQNCMRDKVITNQSQVLLKKEIYTMREARGNEMLSSRTIMADLQKGKNQKILHYFIISVYELDVVVVAEMIISKFAINSATLIIAVVGQTNCLITNCPIT